MTPSSTKTELIEEIYTDNDKEIWWDKKVTTIPPLKHNKADIVY